MAGIRDASAVCLITDALGHGDDSCFQRRFHSLREHGTQGGNQMGKVAAGVTVSVDGYIAGPDDGPGRGLGIGGERLHYWVFGGPWTYDLPRRGEPPGVDKEWL